MAFDNYARTRQMGSTRSISFLPSSRRQYPHGCLADARQQGSSAQRDLPTPPSPTLSRPAIEIHLVRSRELGRIALFVYNVRPPPLRVLRRVLFH